MKPYSEVYKEIQENEYLKLQSDLSEQTNKMKVAVTHQWCMLVRFERKYLVKKPWEHLDNGIKCNEIKEAQSMEEVSKILRENYFCYHLGIIDKDYFLHSKPKWINTTTKEKKHQAGDFGNLSPELYFNKYYKETTTPIIKDNLLKQYWMN